MRQQSFQFLKSCMCTRMNSPTTSTIMAVQERVSFPAAVRFHLQWTVADFTKLYLTGASELYSSGITMAELGMQNLDGRWRMALRPGQVVRLYLTDTDATSRSYTGRMVSLVQLKWGLAVDEATPPISYPYSSNRLLLVSSSKNYDEWKFQDFADTILTISNIPKGQSDFTVTIHVDVELSFPESVRTIGTGERILTENQLEWLKSEPKFAETDFVLRSVDGSEFQTHRNLLITHSPAFAAILSGSVDAEHFELANVDGESIEIMLNYLYACGTEDINSTNAEKVLIMADSFELTGLRTVCEQTLVKNTGGENAVRYLVLACQRDLEGLKEAALRLIPKRIGAVLSDAAAMEMLKRHPQVGEVIMERCVKKMRGIDEQ